LLVLCRSMIRLYIYRLVGCIAALLLLGQCVISKGVTPARISPDVKFIYIVRNDAVLMGGLLPEIEKQLQTMGYQTRVVATPPSGDGYYLTYTANWTWDFAMVLTYFTATLNQNGNALGTARYDSRGGGLNFGKFGPTASKIRPLLHQLMGKAPLPQ
jgi:hypothetical protein